MRKISGFATACGGQCQWLTYLCMLNIVAYHYFFSLIQCSYLPFFIFRNLVGLLHFLMKLGEFKVFFYCTTCNRQLLNIAISLTNICFFPELMLLTMVLLFFYPVCISMFPKCTHESFSQKLYEKFRNQKRFSKPKLSRTAFMIQHYAGEVSIF